MVLVSPILILTKSTTNIQKGVDSDECLDRVGYRVSIAAKILTTPNDNSNNLEWLWASDEFLVWWCFLMDWAVKVVGKILFKAQTAKETPNFHLMCSYKE